MKNFFSLYDEYTKDTEPAKRYHMLGALSVVSNLLGKKAWLPMGHFNIYPNLYILFVGPAGNRKTTALERAEKIFVRANVSKGAATASTSEAVIETMASSEATVNFTYKGKNVAYQQYSPYCSEFATLLGGKHINDGLVKFLTDIYDRASDYTYKTKNKGSYTIENPFFSFLGACVLDWFVDNLKGGLISSGFARRVIFVHADRIYKWFAIPPPEPDTSALLAECERIKKIAGPFMLSEEAKEAYIDFYGNLMMSVNDKPKVLQSYYSTKHVSVLKLCCALSAGISSDRVITKEMFSLSLDIFDDLEQSYEKLFSATGDNRLAKGLSKALELIREKPDGITTARLGTLLYSDFNESEVSEIIRILERSEQVTARTITGTAYPEKRLKAIEQAPTLEESYLLAKAALLSPEIGTLEEDSVTVEQPVADYPNQTQPRSCPKGPIRVRVKP